MCVGNDYKQPEAIILVIFVHCIVVLSFYKNYEFGIQVQCIYTAIYCSVHDLALQIHVSNMLHT